MIRVIHIITGLSTGGAEMMLYKLLLKTDRKKFNPVVISLRDRGVIGSQISALDIPLYTVGIDRILPSPISVLRLIQIVRRLKPDLIQGWMPHGNLAAQFVGTFIDRKIPIIWNIRQSLYSFTYEKQTTELIIKFGSQLSKWPSIIVYNSKIAAVQHEKIGYQSYKTLVISNGFNINDFVPSVECRQSLRRELGIDESTIIIGLIARYHPMKDHNNFIRAAALLSQEYQDVRFVLVGHGVDSNNHNLINLIKNLNILNKIDLLGERHDIPQITAALDISSSSSYGEGFPNVVGEAMACGVPCVVTDVGDSSWVVGNTGRVVPPRNPEALAKSWKELIDLGSEGRAILGKLARNRIIENFSLEAIVAQYEALYESVLTEEFEVKD